MKYYLRDGTEVDDVVAFSQKLSDKDYSRVAVTTLPDGKWISTVWLGIDHQFGDGPPLIFETMVFPKFGDWGELDCRRYGTEQDAIAGHADMVAKWELIDQAARDAFDELETTE